MRILEALALAAALAPFAAGFLLSRARRFDAVEARRATAGAALATLFIATGICLLFGLGRLGIAAGPDGLLAPSSSALLGVRVDGLSVLMLATVAPIGAVVARFAIRYLDGDPRQARFSQWLAFTLSAVTLLAVSGDLILLLVSWLAASAGLHRLLLHRTDRPRAIVAARGRWLVGRAGDACLAAAFALLAWGFGTTEIAQIVDRAAAGEVPAGLSAVVGLIVVAAMTSTAQLPFHAWLPDSMETPTPVSALMHAGLVNAGGYLLIRLSPVLVAAPAALAVLAVVGCATAVFGATVMLVQTDVKRKLAYSTISQMGFMMLQCGLGAFAAAGLHLIGHAYYKGYSFLSAGSQVDPRAEVAVPPKPAEPRLGLVLAGAGIGLVALVAAATVLGIPLTEKPGFGVLAIVLLLGVTQVFLLPDATGRAYAFARVEAAGLGAAMAVAYLAGVALVGQLLGPVLPAQVGFFGLQGAPFAVALCLVFLAVWIFQEFAVRRGLGPTRRALYVHAQNGFYLAMLQRRIVDRIWGPAEVTHHRGENASWA